MSGGERMMLSPQNQAPSDNTATGGRAERDRASILAWREMLGGQRNENYQLDDEEQQAMGIINRKLISNRRNQHQLQIVRQTLFNLRLAHAEQTE